MNKTNLLIELNGKNKITINYDEKYKEEGAKASFRSNDISNDIKVKGKVDTKKLGTYKITYSIRKSGLGKSLYKNVIREVKVVDQDKPVITLSGDSKISLTVGDEYKELGYSATDNYDGDITSNIKYSIKNDKII